MVVEIIIKVNILSFLFNGLDSGTAYAETTKRLVLLFGSNSKD